MQRTIAGIQADQRRVVRIVGDKLVVCFFLFPMDVFSAGDVLYEFIMTRQKSLKH